MDTKEIDWIRKEKYKGNNDPLLEQDITRLNAGEPLDYIIGHSWFLECHIDLQRHPLIPRTETEFWVEETIKDIKDKDKKAETLSILDLFAGSGCIGIALLKHLPFSQVTFGEYDKELVTQIRENCMRNHITMSRTALKVSDVFENISGTFDYIFANPPYIAHSRKEYVEQSVLDHEPHEALFAPDEGLFYIKKILREAPAYVKKNGTLFIEFDSPQEEYIHEFIAEKLPDTYTDIHILYDQYDKPRVLSASKT